MSRQTQFSDARLTSWNVSGEDDPGNCVTGPTMNASDSTPRSGESVSDESLPQQLEETIADELDESLILIQRSMSQGAGVEDVRVNVSEARARLDLLLREIETEAAVEVSQDQ